MNGAAAGGVRVRVNGVRWGQALFWSNEFPKFDLDSSLYRFIGPLIFVLAHSGRNKSFPLPLNFSAVSLLAYEASAIEVVVGLMRPRPLALACRICAD